MFACKALHDNVPTYFIILSHLQTYLDTSTVEDFQKYYVKWRNCSWWVFSYDVTMFLTLFNNYSFKVTSLTFMFSKVCCRLHICEKELIYNLVIADVYSLNNKNRCIKVYRSIWPFPTDIFWCICRRWLLKTLRG